MGESSLVNGKKSPSDRGTNGAKDGKDGPTGTWHPSNMPPISEGSIGQVPLPHGTLNQWRYIDPIGVEGIS